MINPKRAFPVILGYLPTSESLMRYCGDILKDCGTRLLGSELKREEEREDLERCGVEVARDSASLVLESGGGGTVKGNPGSDAEVQLPTNQQVHLLNQTWQLDKG
jgi:hypothetical protein